MKYIHIILLISTLGSLYLSGCKSTEPDVICTQEFAIVAIEVEGGTLDSWQTIRKKNGEVINLPDTFNNRYPVLNDGFQDELEGKTETFIFHGFINNKKVIQEEYVISADKCHIRYQSGKLQIEL